MTTVRVSNKGQITLPAQVRKKLGIKPRSMVTIDFKNDEMVIRLVKPINELQGIFRKYAEGKTGDWEEIRSQAEQDISLEIANG